MADLIPRTERGPLKRAQRALSNLPFSLSRMRDKLDQMFEQLSHNGWRWGVEVRDEADAVVVQADAPGFEAGDFDIHVTDDRLVLRAKKTEAKDKEGKIRERREQECYESVSLPVEIDREKVEARYHNGVLTVTLPKTAEGKGRRIVVKGD